MVSAKDLPEDVVYEVAQRLALSVSSSNSLESPTPGRVHDLLFVCRDWLYPVERVLHKHVKLSTARQAVQYAAMLRRDRRAAHRLVRLDALTENGGTFANQDEPQGALALVEVLQQCQSIRHLKIGLLNAQHGPALLDALAKQRSLRYFVIQNGIGHREHLHVDWSLIVELASKHWPNLRSLDLFGSSCTTLSGYEGMLPAGLNTIFLADSPCTDDELELLLRRVPHGLRELGLSWCTSLTSRGISRLLKQYGKSLRLLTLVSAPVWRSTPDTSDVCEAATLDTCISSLTNLMVLDAEGPWLTARALANAPPTLRSMIVGKCPRLNAAEATLALESSKSLRGLARLGVVLEKDLGMLWSQAEEDLVSAACTRKGVRFDRKWSWDEGELAAALDG